MINTDELYYLCKEQFFYDPILITKFKASV